MFESSFHYEQRRLENDLVVLEPFDPAVHTARFVEVIKSNPSLFTYVSFPTINSETDFVNFYESNIAGPPGECFYAVFDKVCIPKQDESDDNFAGVVALSATSPTNATTEVGAFIFPTFQRTHVATNAVGLLLLRTLDPPSKGGLGLRRVEWKTHSENAASRRTALRMGFELEGIARWQRVFVGGQVALPVDALEKRNGTKGEHPGRYTAIYSIVWDEWDEKRPRVVALMEQRR